MERVKNLIIIGTSHIARQSINEVAAVISAEKPLVVAVELDRKRFIALFERKKEKLSASEVIRRVGFKGYVFSVLGSYVSKKLGDMVGVMPGDEMKRAIREAKATNAKVALIDQDIEITLRRFSQELTWREKWNFVKDIFKSIFFGSSEMKKLKFDLRTVPDKEVINYLMKRVKKDYPNVYKVLITERNNVMADNLIKILQETNGKIVAVVGAGHEEDIAKLIRKKLSSQ